MRKRDKNSACWWETLSGNLLANVGWLEGPKDTWFPYFISVNLVEKENITAIENQKEKKI